MKDYSALAPYYDRFMAFVDSAGEAAVIADFLTAKGCRRGPILISAPVPARISSIWRKTVIK